MRTGQLVLAMCLGVALISGCGGSAATAPPSGQPKHTAAPESRAHVSDSAVVQRVALTAGQLGPGWSAGLMPFGKRVRGVVTLDLCGGGYASETLRDARRQIVILPPGGGVYTGQEISNEVVAYRDGGAVAARAELLHRIATCPDIPVLMPETGGLKVVFKITRLPDDPRWLPGTIAVRSVVTSPGGQSQDRVAIYQFDGNVLSAIYGLAVRGAASANEVHAAALAASALRSAEAPVAA